MKKYLSLLFIWLLTASAAWGYDVVFDATVDIGDGGGNAAPFVISKSGVTVAVSNGISNGQQYRVYKGQTITICSDVGMLSRIVFYCTAPNDERYGPGNLVPQVGDYSCQDIVGIWQGSAHCVTFTAATNQVRITKIIVSVDAEGVLPPKITPVGGTYYEPIEVSITCYEDDATIHYTLDGTEPTAESPEYTAPFVVDTPTTVKAIARIDTSLSQVVTASYEFVNVPPDTGFVNVHSIAELLSQPTGTMVKFTNPVYALAQKGVRLFVTDETGCALFYGSTDQTYRMGDEIPAGFTGEVRFYNGEPELAYLAGFHPATSNRPIEPETIAVTQVGHEMFAHYVLIPNVKLSHQSGNSYLLTDAEGNTCDVYTGTLDCVIPEDLDVDFNVYGIVGSYGKQNVIYQLLPIFICADDGFGFADINDPEIPVGQRVKFTYDATVMLQNKNYLYARDKTGYAMIYGNVGQVYKQGDVIPAGFTCVKQVYNGQVQLASPQDFEPSVRQDELVPEQAAISQFSYCRYHYVTPGMVTLHSDNDPVGLVSSGIMTDMDGNSCRYTIVGDVIPSGWTIVGNHSYKVYGVVDFYGSGSQVYPCLLITRIDNLDPLPPVEVASIDELYDLPQGYPAQFTTPLVAVYYAGANLYVKDVEGNFGLVYNSCNDGMVNGSIINDAKCHWTAYHGSNLIIPDEGAFVSSGTGPAVEPDDMRIEDISREMEHRFVKFSDVTIRVVGGYLTTVYSMSDGTEEMTFEWAGRLPKGKHLPMPYELSGELSIADINALIDVILSHYEPWDGKYDVTGFIRIEGDELTITPYSVSCDGHGYDLSACDLNSDGEINIADVNVLIDLIVYQ